VLLRSRRSAVAAASVVLLAASLTSVLVSGSAQARPAGNTAASRFQAQQCSSRPGGSSSCSFAEDLTLPMSVSVTADATPEGASASVSWTISCSVNGGSAVSSSGSKSGGTPFSTALGLPKSSGGECTLNATVSLSGSGSLTATLNYSLAHQVNIWVPTHDPGPGAPLAYLDCITASGNKIGSRAVLGNCADYYATAWVPSGNRLVHHGLCLTDPRNGGIRTQLVLERCTGASDQAWSFGKDSAGYPQLVVKGNRMCLDDPKYTERNGTPLIVYSCNGNVEQRWSLS
jgi:hypothetical protein